MQIRIKKKTKQYAQVHKNLLFHQKVSIQAKGLGAIFECYSDDFTISMSSLEIHASLHRDTIRKYLKELENHLFLFRVQIIKDCKMIWFFDSEHLDIQFLIKEVEKLKKYQKIRFLTAYEILAPEKIGTEKLATYNNTTNSTFGFTDFDALQIMYRVEKDLENQKGKERNSKSDYYTNSSGKAIKKQFFNKPISHKQNDEIKI